MFRLFMKGTIPMQTLQNTTSSLLRAPATLLLNLPKVSSNIIKLESLLPPNGRLMAMIKAFGYGFDDWQLSNALEDLGIEIFGVAYPQEAVALRNKGMKKDVFVIHATPDQAECIVDFNLEVAVSTPGEVDSLQEAAKKRGRTVKVHLHINTGMTRFGACPRESLYLARHIMQSSSLKLSGIMTHFPSADDEEQDAFTLSQIKTIEDIVEALYAEGIDVPWIHGANSAGLLRLAPKRFNMARVGLSIFGVSNSEGMRKRITLDPAVSLYSHLVHIHDCRQGDTVGYNRDYIVKKNHERIGVISCGYHDGLPRSLSGKGYVYIQGKRAPYVGRICMDYMMVDLTDIPEAVIGDDVLLFGGEDSTLIPVELFSSWAGTISHEIFCRISGRVKRAYVPLPETNNTTWSY
ncbi:alanine racemase [Estrella lausannensis]|uniref:Alanine racemase n=1 Tax=Estrella lausannensis TaxID=483423 RepID=A0A0H5DT01_9BACT|nr:alanine racemase [Estrella lausannensis]CRX39478.1 Alanine racemase [Estrella lausannensis]